jgi:hypothetical protein
MDFTYPTDLAIAAFISFALSLIALLVSLVARRSVPRGYAVYISGLVVVFCAAISLRWTDWRGILLTSFGLMDLGLILGFSAIGAVIGLVPLWLFGRRRPVA